MLRTRLCPLLGVELPVLNAPMGGGDAPASLAAAVSEAGGLGLVGGTTALGVPWLVEQVRRARELTDRPFGVGLLGHRPGAQTLARAALDEGVRVLAVSFADPRPFVRIAHEAGALVVCQVRTVEEARSTAAAAVDVVTAQGTEAGGHTGRVSTLPLVPAVVDAVAPLPVVAAGGIGDGRALAAALMLGAEGAWIGTRLLATRESGIPDAAKARVVSAGTGDTVLTDVFDVARATPWPDGVSGRAIANRFSRRWDGRADQLAELVAWFALPEPPLDDVEEQAVWAGEVVGSVAATEGAGDVVRGIAAEAERVMRGRVASVSDGGPG